MKKLYFIILNTLIIFPPLFRIFPKWTWLVSLLGIFCLFDKKTSIKLGFYSKKFFYTMLLIVISLILAIIIPMSHYTYDFTYAPLLIGLILSLLRGIFLIYNFHYIFKEKANFDLYVKIFLISCVIYVLFSITFIIFPQFKDFWFNNIIMPFEASTYIAYKFRYGFDGFAAFGTASIFSIAVLLNAYVLISSNLNKKDFNKVLLSYILIIVGCFLYGRITIFAILISMIYMLLFCENKKKIFKIFSVLLLIIVILYSILIKLSEMNGDIKIWINWAFEFIHSIIGGKDGEIYSVKHMFEDMYFIPSIKTIMIGDGRYMSLDGTGYYMSTDVGFIRPMLVFGILGVIINYTSLAIILKNMYVLQNSMKNNPAKLLIICIFIITIILEMKGEAFHRVLYCIIPLYFLSYKDSNKVKQRKVV